MLSSKSSPVYLKMSNELLDDAGEEDNMFNRDWPGEMVLGSLIDRNKWFWIWHRWFKACVS